jgi:hypothetical protein
MRSARIGSPSGYSGIGGEVVVVVVTVGVSGTAINDHELSVGSCVTRDQDMVTDEPEAG